MIAVRAPSVLLLYALVQRQFSSWERLLNMDFGNQPLIVPQLPRGAKSPLYHPEWKQGKGSFSPRILGSLLLCCRDLPAIA